MADEKLELLLNAALEATPQEREKSQALNVGFDTETKRWEVIVKYHGDLLFLEELSIGVEELLAGYAILTVPEDKMTLMSQIEEIEYVEKPKRLYFETAAGKQASCILPVTIRPPYLSGRGVLIGIADSGIDYSHPAFRRMDGTTRILALWDQSLPADPARGFLPPEGFLTGAEFTQEQINAALGAGGSQESAGDGMEERENAGGTGSTPRPETGESVGQEEVSVPERDISGHGTAVAGIAAGTEGVAPESELLIVKLGIPRAESFPRTTELMRAVTYLVKKAVSMNRPIAVNLSFGNTYGPHDGTSLLERFLDNASEVGRCVVCVGSGNEGAAMGHAAGIIGAGMSASGVTGGFQSGMSMGGVTGGLQSGVGMGGAADGAQRIELSVGAYESAFSVQLWKNYADTFQITLISPGGERFVFSTDEIGEERLRRVRLEQTELLLYIGEPTPYSAQQEIYFDFLPSDRYVNEGIWSFLLSPVRIVTGNYSMYLPSQTAVGTDTRFFRPAPEVTLTIPSTSPRVVTVGAYDTTYDAYADFSGRGYLFAANAQERAGIALSKPDLVAPGVGIVTAAPGGGSVSVTGTSFATPFVTGSAALLMEWGDGVIIRLS
ncbi:MAG: S8 family serine peptidase [Lachnospiraceae bacterium]|nr:S8 family serine peptidase [Lachnospiraceae bacterium]